MGVSKIFPTSLTFCCHSWIGHFHKAPLCCCVRPLKTSAVSCGAASHGLNEALVQQFGKISSIGQSWKCGMYEECTRTFQRSHLSSTFWVSERKLVQRSAADAKVWEDFNAEEMSLFFFQVWKKFSGGFGFQSASPLTSCTKSQQRHAR